MRRRIAAAALALALLAGCGPRQKDREFGRDAPRAGVDSAPADTGEMPDGFSNYATKCDHGNRVYVLFHWDADYGGIAVAPRDPTCLGGGGR